MSKSPIVARAITTEVILALKHYPFVSITGPRQSGKTTLCHLVAVDYQYVNLEIDENKEFATKDPTGFIKKYPYKVILDEVQSVPNLFRYLLNHTDAQGKNGAYILSGSQNFLLMEKISQTLAGRVAIFSLLPFSLSEFFPYLRKVQKNWMQLCINGFYPRLFNEKKINVNLFYHSYVKTYVERDIRAVLNIHNSKAFIQFLKLCAVRVGNIFNAQEIAAKIGVDNKTIQSWMGILETSYIAYTLPAYFNNFDKRIIKKPKLYFYDSGVVCYLLNIKTKEQLSNHNLLGAIFENFVINEKLKSAFNKAENPEFYFWQDSNGKEVDLLIQRANYLDLIEIKSSSTPKSEFAKNVLDLATLAKANGQKTKQYVMYTGDETYTMKTVQYTSWLKLLED
jgi:uncharacterized protein